MNIGAIGECTAEMIAVSGKGDVHAKGVGPGGRGQRPDTEGQQLLFHLLQQVQGKSMTAVLGQDREMGQFRRTR